MPQQPAPPAGPTAAQLAAAKTAHDTGVEAIAAAADKAAAKAAYDTALMNQHLSAMQKSNLVAKLTERNQALERMAIDNAITALGTALAAVTDTSDDARVTTADTALAAAKAAVTEATSLDQSERDVHNKRVMDHETRLTTAKTSRTNAMAAAAEAMRMEMLAKGKALKTALGTNPLAYLRDMSGAEDTDGTDGAPEEPAGHNTGVTLTGSVLRVAADANGDGTAALPTSDPPGDLTTATLTPGESAGMLGNWKGTNYAHGSTTTGARIKNSSLVYTNQEDPTTKAFSSEYGTGNPSQADGTYNSEERLLTITVNTVGVAAKIKSPEFPTVGTETFPAQTTGAQGSTKRFRGTYDGAAGFYQCTSVAANGTGCTAAADDDGGITLAGTWLFQHDSGAMVTRDDPNYLYFGWWLLENDEGPTHASAFFGMVGTENSYTDYTTTSLNGLNGSATYNGKAAGKFAIYEPNRNTGDGGHFTADVMLTAEFSTDDADGGIKGMINNFRLNDATEGPGWSVELKRIPWTASVAVATFGDAATTDGTVWSINGAEAAASGRWRGQMFDTTDDDNTAPTAVLGKFQSRYGATHAMVGAFGAEKDD